MTLISFYYLPWILASTGVTGLGLVAGSIFTQATKLSDMSWMKGLAGKDRNGSGAFSEFIVAYCDAL